MWVFAIIEGSLHQCSSILLAVEQLHLVGHPSHRDRGIEVDIHFITLLTFLSGDDDHTIGSTATVDRS